jgi:hypothetical protein
MFFLSICAILLAVLCGWLYWRIHLLNDEVEYMCGQFAKLLAALVKCLGVEADVGK